MAHGCAVVAAQEKGGTLAEKKANESTSHTNTLLQRFRHDSTHGAKTSAGHKSMQALKLPPGQSPGVGVGVGAGGVGVGAGGVGAGGVGVGAGGVGVGVPHS